MGTLLEPTALWQKLVGDKLTELFFHDTINLRFMRLLVQILGNSLGIYVASIFIPGFSFRGDLKILILAGVVLGAVNFFLKPIIKIITLPLRLLTFGFFSFVISAAVVFISRSAG